MRVLDAAKTKSTRIVMKCYGVAMIEVKEPDDFSNKSKEVKHSHPPILLNILAQYTLHLLRNNARINADRMNK